MSRGIIIAAPGSGSGKTTITLALLKCLRESGLAVASGKAGPDYIDPAYHSAASGRACHNLDTWCMSDNTLCALVQELNDDATLVIVEGVMGLFDGAPDGTGSAADLSRRTGWPVLLVVDAAGMAASVVALVEGFANHDPRVPLAGVIFNRVGSASHGELLRRAMAGSDIPVLGCVTRCADLTLPDRHLGLVQAREHPDLDGFLDRAARHVGASVDLDLLIGAARPTTITGASPSCPLPPLGQHIAVARDDAFAFCYPYVLDSWRRAGCSIELFSPLADEAPSRSADAVYLPGGYPELHAKRLAGAGNFFGAMRECADRGAFIYGECGGYMVLGRSLTDANGEAQPMLGLLPVETSFATRKLNLGYRQVTLADDCALGRAATIFRGHEFHFASVVAQDPADALFHAANAEGKRIGLSGLRVDSVMGSFIHLVDQHSG